MTQDDIICMAWKTGLVIDGNFSGNDDLFAFANLVAAHKAEVITAEAYRCGHEVAAELRRLHEVNQELLEALREIDNWLVCACIATPEDMAQSVTHMEQVAQAAIAKAERTTT